MSSTAALHIALPAHLQLIELENGNVALQRDMQPIIYKQPPPGWRLALKQLAAGGASEQELAKTVLEAEGHNALLQFYPRLQRLLQAGLLSHSLLVDGQPFATITPFASGYTFRELHRHDQTYQISRFAYTHSEQGQIKLDSPLAHASITLHSPKASLLLALLAQPQSAANLAEASGIIDTERAGHFLNLLLNIQAVTLIQANGKSAEESSPTFGQWEFHDLVFHSQSRFGRHRGPYGGAYASRGKFEPLPVVKEIYTDQVIPLPKPDMAKLIENDPPLSAIIERRRSIRVHGEKPISLEQLGEFFYRVARIKKIITPDEDGLEVNFRPYPAGGALYELEIYPVIHRCAGVDSGLYYYHPLNHHLCKVADRTPLVDEVLTMAATTATMTTHPQIFLAITARFQRVQWKYQSVAYALMLKHVGVLYQSMYLAATAMGLAPCGLGGGNSDLFSRAAGLDYYAETTVGDFILGSNGETRA